jgi:putative PIN family toxin of toxin-antitoxin system
MRVVIDTNIWISGLLFGGNPQKIIELGKAKEITIICSLPLLDEISETLNYAKFRTRLAKLGVTVEDLLLSIYACAKILPTTEIESVANLRDPDDLKVLATAVNNLAVVIVSGDSDLLILKEYKGIAIMTATEFLTCYFSD